MLEIVTKKQRDKKAWEVISVEKDKFEEYFISSLSCKTWRLI